jgi:protein-disulfide isomerase
MLKPQTRTVLKSALDTTVSLAFVVLCGAIAWSLFTGRASLLRNEPAAPREPSSKAARTPAALPTEPVSLEGAVLKGANTASVAVIEYSEFQCPFCGKFTKGTLPTLTTEYVDSGRVVWAFRNFPLERIHPHAFKAAVAGECAERQGKFWQMHTELFADPMQLDETNLHARARKLGLDQAAFTQCLNGPADAEVRADMATAQALGVTGTPAFFVGRIEPNRTVRLLRRITGAVPVDEFKGAIDAVLGLPVAATR